MRSRSVCAVLFVALAGLTVVGAAPAPAEGDLLARIDRGLTGVMWMIKSAKTKLVNDVRGTGGEMAATESMSPALLCCEANLDKVRDKLKDVLRAVNDVEAGVAARPTPDAETMDVIASFESQASILIRALESFANAPTKKEAEAGLGAITTAFLRTRKSADLLLERMGYERPAEDAKAQ